MCQRKKGLNLRLTLAYQRKNFSANESWALNLSAALSEVFKALLDQLRNEIRGKRYSIRTEQE
jgi:hypothetical protein